MAIVKENSPKDEIQAVMEIRKHILKLVKGHLKGCTDITDVYSEDVSIALKMLENELDVSEVFINLNDSSTGLDESTEFVEICE